MLLNLYIRVFRDYKKTFKSIKQREQEQDYGDKKIIYKVERGRSSSDLDRHGDLSVGIRKVNISQIIRRRSVNKGTEKKKKKKNTTPIRS